MNINDNTQYNNFSITLLSRHTKPSSLVPWGHSSPVRRGGAIGILYFLGNVLSRVSKVPSPSQGLGVPRGSSGGLGDREIGVASPCYSPPHFKSTVHSVIKRKTHIVSHPLYQYNNSLSNSMPITCCWFQSDSINSSFIKH